MLRYCLGAASCILLATASAQPVNEAAVEAMAQEIARTTSTEFSCELVVLWTYRSQAPGRYLARAHADGSDCDSALIAASRKGNAFGISFHRIPGPSAVRSADFPDIAEYEARGREDYAQWLEERREFESWFLPGRSNRRYDLIDDRLPPRSVTPMASPEC